MHRTVKPYPHHLRALASSIIPRFSKTIGPHATLFSFCFSLGVRIAAFAVLGPVERKPVSHKPISDIRRTDSANRHRSLPPVAIYLDAFDGASINEVEQRIRYLLSASELFAVFIPAKLIGRGRIDSEYANTGTVNFDSIAIDDGCLSNQVTGECQAIDGE